MSVTGLRSAPRAEPALAVRQRLGYVLEVLGRECLAATLHASLPRRLTPVQLKVEGRGGAASRSAGINEPWAVYDNVALLRNLS